MAERARILESGLGETPETARHLSIVGGRDVYFEVEPIGHVFTTRNRRVPRKARRMLEELPPETQELCQRAAVVKAVADRKIDLRPYIFYPARQLGTKLVCPNVPRAEITLQRMVLGRRRDRLAPASMEIEAIKRGPCDVIAGRTAVTIGLENYPHFHDDDYPDVFFEYAANGRMTPDVKLDLLQCMIIEAYYDGPDGRDDHPGTDFW